MQCPAIKYILANEKPRKYGYNWYKTWAKVAFAYIYRKATSKSYVRQVLFSFTPLSDIQNASQ